VARFPTEARWNGSRLHCNSTVVVERVGVDNLASPSSPFAVLGSFILAESTTRHLGDGVRTRLFDLECHDDRGYTQFPSDRSLAVFEVCRSGCRFRGIGGERNGQQLAYAPNALGANGIVVEFVCGEAAATRGGP
jgi:hypothetical protein